MERTFRMVVEVKMSAIDSDAEAIAIVQKLTTGQVAATHARRLVGGLHHPTEESTVTECEELRA